jgi:hypothetical protein
MDVGLLSCYKTTFFQFLNKLNSFESLSSLQVELYFFHLQNASMFFSVSKT